MTDMETCRYCSKWGPCPDHRSNPLGSPPQAAGPQPEQETLRDDVQGRMLAAIRILHDLKEDILFRKLSIQPEFDAGMLEAAITILFSNLDDEDDERVNEERQRQCNARLLLVLESSALPPQPSTSEFYMADDELECGADAGRDGPFVKLCTRPKGHDGPHHHGRMAPPSTPSQET